MPQPKKWSDRNCQVYNVDEYWQAVGGDLPAIYFVYRIMSNCCATEAATEPALGTGYYCRCVIKGNSGKSSVS